MIEFYCDIFQYDVKSIRATITYDLTDNQKNTDKQEDKISAEITIFKNGLVEIDVDDLETYENSDNVMRHKMRPLYYTLINLFGSKIIKIKRDVSQITAENEPDDLFKIELGTGVKQGTISVIKCINDLLETTTSESAYEYNYDLKNSQNISKKCEEDCNLFINAAGQQPQEKNTHVNVEDKKIDNDEITYRNIKSAAKNAFAYYNIGLTFIENSKEVLGSDYESIKNNFSNWFPIVYNFSEYVEYSSLENQLSTIKTIVSNTQDATEQIRELATITNAVTENINAVVNKTTKVASNTRSMTILTLVSILVSFIAGSIFLESIKDSSSLTHIITAIITIIVVIVCAISICIIVFQWPKCVVNWLKKIIPDDDIENEKK